MVKVYLLEHEYRNTPKFGSSLPCFAVRPKSLWDFVLSTYQCRNFPVLLMGRATGFFRGTRKCWELSNSTLVTLVAVDRGELESWWWALEMSASLLKLLKAYK